MPICCYSAWQNTVFLDLSRAVIINEGMTLSLINAAFNSDPICIFQFPFSTQKPSQTNNKSHPWIFQVIFHLLIIIATIMHPKRQIILSVFTAMKQKTTINWDCFPVASQ